jgi:lactate racemase
MDIALGIGTRLQTITIPDENLAGVLTPNPAHRELTEESEIHRALFAPIGTPPLREIVHPSEKIAIVTSDITRPMPTAKVMPTLLDELYAAGVRMEDITLVFALGSHRAHTDAERRKLAGKRAFTEITCVDSDPMDFVHLGVTRRGTPVDITRVVAEADRRICLGNIEYHYFAGYSGGGKAIMPGVSTRSAIQSNHSMMVLPEACAGRLEGNPIREDIEEAAKICGVDFILNVVLTEHKEILRAFAGDVVSSHRAGCAFIDTLYRVDVPDYADIVVVSQGGAPKDLNLYQTQKALDNAKHAVRKGGIVILVGSCIEGMGEKTFEEWMLTARKPDELVDRIHREFKLGGHKAAAIAMVLQNADIYLVSDLEPEFVRRLFMQPFSNVQDALNTAIVRLGKKAKVLVMPYGGSTLPRVLNKQ